MYVHVHTYYCTYNNTLHTYIIVCIILIGSKKERSCDTKNVVIFLLLQKELIKFVIKNNYIHIWYIHIILYVNVLLINIVFQRIIHKFKKKIFWWICRGFVRKLLWNDLYVNYVCMVDLSLKSLLHPIIMILENLCENLFINHYLVLPSPPFSAFVRNRFDSPARKRRLINMAQFIRFINRPYVIWHTWWYKNPQNTIVFSPQIELLSTT